MTGRRRVTSAVLDDLRRDITPEDLEVLGTLYRVRLATGLQLQHLHHGQGDAAKQRRMRQLARLSRLQLVVRLDRRVGGLAGGSRSTVYTLDMAGLRLVDPTGQARRPWSTSTPFMSHAITVTRCLVDLSQSEREGDLELLKFDAEPRCWRHYRDRAGRHMVLKPDADVAVAAGEFEYHAWLEVDLATESRPRLLAKSQLYVDYLRTGAEQDRRGVAPRVLWLTTTDERCELIRGTLASLRRSHPGAFTIATLDHLAGALVSEDDL